ncbi:MAG TPA: RidA family protein [Mycobacteriales bacterium]|nr:RidA family protein [Mycobacteriales bacterium]
MTASPSAAERLAALGLHLPPVPPPAGHYLPARRHGDLVFTAGQLPLVDGTLPCTGLVGGQVSAEQARDCARLAALGALAAIVGLVGDLDAVTGIVKVTGFVASAPGFTAQSAVLNGASELLGTVFADAGKHARSAVGVAALPLDAPVEVEVIASVR